MIRRIWKKITNNTEPSTIKFNNRMNDSEKCISIIDSACKNLDILERLFSSSSISFDTGNLDEECIKNMEDIGNILKNKWAILVKSNKRIANLLFLNVEIRDKYLSIIDEIQKIKIDVKISKNNVPVVNLNNINKIVEIIQNTKKNLRNLIVEIENSK